MFVTMFLRTTARLLSLALAVLVAAIALGEGLPSIVPPSAHLVSLALLAVSLIGLLLAWRWEIVGAAMGLFGSAGFYLTDYYLSGFQSFPSGWAFPLLLATPLLYLAASAWEGGRGTPKPAS